MKKILLLLFLVSFVNGAGISWMKFIDTTGDGYSLAHLYQNDNVSSRYIKTINFSQQRPHTIGVDYNYSLIIEPTQMGIYKDLSGDNLISYLYHNFWFWMIAVAIIITVLSIAYLVIVKGRRIREG